MRKTPKSIWGPYVRLLSVYILLSLGTGIHAFERLRVCYHPSSTGELYWAYTCLAIWAGIGAYALVDLARLLYRVTIRRSANEKLLVFMGTLFLNIPLICVNSSTGSHGKIALQMLLGMPIVGIIIWFIPEGFKCVKKLLQDKTILVALSTWLAVVATTACIKSNILFSTSKIEASGYTAVMDIVEASSICIMMSFIVAIPSLREAFATLFGQKKEVAS